MAAWTCSPGRRGELAFAASDLCGLPRAGGPESVRLDWTVIPAILSAPGLAADRTALNVESVAPGAMQPLGGSRGDAVALWRPADFVGSDLAHADDLAAQLRACVERSVDGLAADGRFSVEVSGGLDSAIVAAALMRTGRRAQVAEAVNYHARSVLADERDWARAVCGHLDLPLRCVPRVTPPWREEDYAELSRHARPPVNALDTPRDRLGADLARRAGATAIFSGKGGDGVFFQRATALVLADRAQADGPQALLTPFARETARWLRRSIWSVGWEAARAAKAPPGRYAAGLGAHPWLYDLEALPPGKRFQVAALAAAQGHRGVNRRTLTADVLHPLLSQPVMELCLAIPSWRLVEDSGTLHGRALARRAFSDSLPATVVWRRSKGDLTTHYSRWIAASRDSLLPVLRDGVLADAGLVDRAAVAEALDPDRLIYRSDARGLLSAAALEFWIRHWQGRVPDLGRRPSVDSA
ncbi:asparagine synthase C-terminal domain-containing protein [Phenylobacterium sp. J367]|uniref:asparagine synthase-related protein n=1 Tax=Phenylobacterium sp. J367 TaxID=2898435 RepID=UPI002150DD86|nr:asparagine synthase C-terminal domain-containing protein [Phenylobacterium sp. J367]MCR5879456.1 asparagine synthase C-terminal domain-containing protein [Phenylobacterium sp. J367]